MSLVACDPEAVDTEGNDQDNSDIADALSRLGDATVLDSTQDGVPTYIVGDMAQVGDTQIDDLGQAEAAIKPALAPVLAAFRMTTDEVKLRKVNVDEAGTRFYRFDMTSDGMDVIGGDMVVRVDIAGAITGINGFGRGDLPRDDSSDISSSVAASTVSRDARFDQLAMGTPRKVYLITSESKRYRAYEVVAEGYRGQDPVRDAVYVDAQRGDIVAVHPKIHHAKYRRVYSANNGTSLPGTLKRSEGGAATSDTDVNAAYDNTGSAYDMYSSLFARDSYNNAGATLTSSVHYSTNYCNAFWDGSRMVYGDGSGSSCLPLARSVDVTAHELTHAVTQNESNLTYSGQSGGINESMSDIFGAVTEAFVTGGATGTLTVSADTWLVGEDVWSPFLRKMSDPAADGVSLDYWTSNAGNVDVHYSSGIGNLIFYLLSQGGTHPRGASTAYVTGIGITKAARVFYKANVDHLTASSNYAALRTAAEQSASELGLTTYEQTSVSCAFAAVGVGTVPTSGCTPAKSDILWRCVPQPPATSCGAAAAGSTAIWKDGNAAQTSYPGVVDSSWQIVGTGDFNGDGRKDILWRSTSGNNVIWPGAQAPGYWLASVGSGWNVAGIGDFDGNGKSDILWRSVNGDNVIWPEGVGPGYWITQLNTTWQVAGIGDFNGNDKSDILWRSTTGDNAIWQDAAAPGYWIGATTTDWSVAGVGDFDGSRTGDILWRSNTGNNVIWSGGVAPGVWITALDTGWRVTGVSDFDGNGLSDILWRRANGENALWLDGSAPATVLLTTLDNNWQVAGVGDYIQ